ENLVRIVPVASEAPIPHECGRPCLQFDLEWLADAMSSSHCIPLQTLARMLGIHQNTLCHHLQMNSLSRKYADILDKELDVLIHSYKCDHPNAGLQFVIAFLKSHRI
ncbi:hypothetical protein J3R83DRAFT_3182, partial [Lanmaoa asiatica]